jgi:hypothetical protein
MQRSDLDRQHFATKRPTAHNYMKFRFAFTSSRAWKNNYISASDPLAEPHLIQTDVNFSFVCRGLLCVIGFTVSFAGVGVLAEESTKVELDESGINLADRYACIGGDFVACLRSYGFQCDPYGNSYMCSSSHSPNVVFRIGKDSDNEGRVLAIPKPRSRCK